MGISVADYELMKARLEKKKTVSGTRQTAKPKATTKPKAAPKPKRVRQKESGMNKLEQDFLLYLKAFHPSSPPHIQAVTLLLANGVRYTPDFVIYENGKVIAYETKGGFMRDDAAVKIKVAASVYPWIKFYLVWRSEGSWKMQGIIQ